MKPSWLIFVDYTFSSHISRRLSFRQFRMLHYVAREAAFEAPKTARLADAAALEIPLPAHEQAIGPRHAAISGKFTVERGRLLRRYYWCLIPAVSSYVFRMICIGTTSYERHDWIDEIDMGCHDRFRHDCACADGEGDAA